MRAAAIFDPHPCCVDIANEHLLLLPAGFRNGNAYLRGEFFFFNFFSTVRYLQPTLLSSADNAAQKDTTGRDRAVAALNLSF